MKTVPSSVGPEGLIEGIQKFAEETEKMVADSLVSLNQAKKFPKVLNMRNEAINIYHDSKIARFTDLRNQIQEHILFSSKERPQH